MFLLLSGAYTREIYATTNHPIDELLLTHNSLCTDLHVGWDVAYMYTV